MAAEARAVLTGCAHDCGGKCLLAARVRDGRVVRITGEAGVVRGVALLPAGAWVRWDADGVDVGDGPNTLTADEGTAWMCASTQQTALVQVERAC